MDTDESKQFDMAWTLEKNDQPKVTKEDFDW